MKSDLKSKKYFLKVSLLHMLCVTIQNIWKDPPSTLSVGINWYSKINMMKEGGYFDFLKTYNLLKENDRKVHFQKKLFLINGVYKTHRTWCWFLSCQLKKVRSGGKKNPKNFNYIYSSSWRGTKSMKGAYLLETCSCHKTETKSQWLCLNFR